ncbi:MAG TPA: septum formation initiator family protein [Candidatus Babeliales bacterium]|nr:septum formation initiator family protein [Candidatus Babeliales bacterium]
MIYIKKIFIRCVVLLEITLFTQLYFFGPNGIVELRNQEKVVFTLKKTIDTLREEVIKVEKEIHAWQTDDFYKEKVAREQLQMARKGDELFYIGI